MRIKVYILTWNDSEALERNIRTLYDNMGDKPSHVNIEVNIINNHPNFYLPDDIKDKVNVLNNVLRIPESRGHLARNWNQGLLNGFRSLNRPQAEIVINIQDDMLWSRNWLTGILDIHSKYSFYTCSWGDGFCSYTPEAVKKIGIWDERFCGNGLQECDYFLRALIYNKEKSSINCTGVGMVVNPYGMLGGYVPPQAGTKPSWDPPIPHFVANRPNIINRDNGAPIDHPYLIKLFNIKWGIHYEFWSQELIDNPSIKPKLQTYWTYPYFECGIEDLSGKGYI